MYNPVNLSVSTSPLLIRSLYAIHGALVLAWLSVLYAHFHWTVMLTICPALVVQALHIKQLLNKQFVFLNARHWQFFNGKARLQQGTQWQNVELGAHQVWSPCVIVKYRQVIETPLQKPSAWQWDILMYDACETESFRQLIALMRTEYQGKAS